MDVIVSTFLNTITSFSLGRLKSIGLDIKTTRRLQKVDIIQRTTLYTVGAQSIACAQSIAPSLIGDNIWKKPKFLKNYFYRR